MTRTLVTGGAGFIGSWLVERLLADGRDVTVVDNLSTGRAANLASVANHPKLGLVEGDIADEALIARLVGGADEVYHLAAAVGVQLVAKDPVRTIAVNVRPTEHLLAAAAAQHRSGRPMRVFLASTSEVYGKNPKPTWKEDDDLVFGPTTRLRWSYGASKAIDEFLALAYFREDGLPVVIGRFFNVVGPRQVGSYGMVLPRLAQAALAGREMIVHDDGKQSRCFAHVADVVRVVIELMNSPKAVGQVFNIGSDQPISILDLAHEVARAVPCEPKIKFQTYTDAYGADFEDVRHRVPDVTKLRETLGYRPEYDLRRTVQSVVDHQREALRAAAAK